MTSASVECWHGSLSRSNAVRLLQSRGLQNGMYLCRAGQGGNAPVISLVAREDVQHFVVQFSPQHLWNGFFWSFNLLKVPGYSFYDSWKYSIIFMAKSVLWTLKALITDTLKCKFITVATYFLDGGEISRSPRFCH